jgi:hypothetical protein
MNFQPLLACGPSGSLVIMILATLGTGALSLVSGIVCLCLGSKGLGAFLLGAPLAVFGTLYLLATLH